MKCAVDCIISVISNNESILNNIADNIKINKSPTEKEIEKTMFNNSNDSKKFMNFTKEKDVSLFSYLHEKNIY